MNNNITLPASLNITGISADSREIKPNMLFAALSGTNTDGRKYIEKAIDSGAIAILAPVGTKLPESSGHVYLLESDNCRAALSALSASYYKDQPKNIVAVTGTNGKSSTVFFASQIMSLLGKDAVSIGTLGIHGRNISIKGSMTTMDPVNLHKNLKILSDDNIEFVAMEASSHGIFQHRIDNVKLKAAAFTNFTRDHLDYHGSMDEYFAVKSRLFADIVPENGYAVINSDIKEYEILSKICELRNIHIIDYGHKADKIKIIERTAVTDGQLIKIKVNNKIYETKIHQVGEFQLMNILAAIGLVMAVEGNNIIKNIIGILHKLESPDGRVELVAGHPLGASIYVDYAHTPDALENVIQALRPHTDGKLVTIIGCGGDRDHGKRPVMGHIAAKYSDIAIITDDNPRSENPEEIRSAMLSGIDDKYKSSILEIGDRHQAIIKGVSLLGAGDILLIAGKGHETGQILSSKTLPFDDVQEAQSAISHLKSNRKIIS